MSTSTIPTSLQERFCEIADASRAEQQVEALIELAKARRLERCREERIAAWDALFETCRAHLTYLKGIAPSKRARKPPAPPLPVTDAKMPPAFNVLPSQT